MRRSCASISLAVMLLGLVSFATNQSPAEAAPRSACSALNSPGYERINRTTTATLITAWRTEASNAAKKFGYTWNRGTPYRVSTTPGAGLVGIHRTFNSKSRDFRYVWKSADVKSLKRHGYRDQGRVFYAAKSRASCLRPVYRYSRKGVTQYAVSSGRRKALSSHHWKYQNVAFYVGPVAKSHRAPAVDVPVSGGPLARPLYVPKSSYAWRAYQNAGDRNTKRRLYQIAGTPSAMWLGGASTDGGWVKKVTASAAAQGRTPVWVLYAIPHRNCGVAFAGGLNGKAAYESWIRSVRAGINKKPAVVIVEPDAIGMNCLTAAQRADRIAMLRYAMQTLSQDKNTVLYIHGGSNGLYAPTFASILKQVGVGYGRGFALNVSGFDTTANEEKYGDALVRNLTNLGVPGMHYVIDTSRNGVGRRPDGSCNARGAALGKRPTTATGKNAVDAWLWIKPPGETDGYCHPGDPGKGWFQSYALDITKRAIDKGIITEQPLP